MNYWEVPTSLLPAAASLKSAWREALMPLVRQAEAAEARAMAGYGGGGDLEEVVALFEAAMEGFTAASIKRPKLAAKLAAAQRTLDECSC